MLSFLATSRRCVPTRSLPFLGPGSCIRGYRIVAGGWITNCESSRRYRWITVVLTRWRRIPRSSAGCWHLVFDQW